jgi:stage V sporulation protein B
LTLNKTLKDIQWSVFSSIIPSIGYLLIRIILSKEFGASELGLYTLVYTVYIFGMQAASFGVSLSLTKFISEFVDDIHKVKDFVSNGIIISFLSGLCMFLLLFTFSDFISVKLFNMPEMGYLLRITSISFPFMAVQKAVFGVLNGKREMKSFAFLNCVQYVLMLVFSIIFVFNFKFGIAGAIIGLTFSTIVTAIISLFYITNLFQFNFQRFYQVSKILLHFGFYVLLISSIDVININMVSLFIGYFMNKTEVGYYSIAMTLLQSITLIPNAIGRVSFPTISNYHSKRDYKNINTFMKTVMLNTFVISLIIFIFFIVFGKFLIKTLFTIEFLPAYIPLLILLGGYLLFTPIVSIGGTLACFGKINYLFRIALFSTVLNMILSIILIPHFGITGAAVATSLSLIIGGILQFYFIFTSLNSFYRTSLNKS